MTLWDAPGSDHGILDTRVIILGNTVPSLELNALLSLPEYSLRCKWLEGSVLVDTDLVRCDATKAICTFIFCDKTASSADQVYEEVCVSVCVSVCVCELTFSCVRVSVTVGCTRRTCPRARLVASTHACPALPYACTRTPGP